MSTLKSSSAPSNEPLRTKRTPMACCFCRDHKVKCLPRDDQLGHPCERCLAKGLSCSYMTVAEQAHRQTTSDSIDAGPSPPDSAAQGVTGDNAVILSDGTQYDFVPHFPAPAYETHSDDYRGSVDVTHFANQPVSDPRAFDQLPGAGHSPERPHYYESSIPSSYANSSNTNTVWHGHDAIAPVLAESSFSPPSSLPWVHGYDACPYHGPFACNCPPERHGPL